MLQGILRGLFAQPADWLTSFLTVEGLRQVGALVFALLAAWPLSRLLERLLERAKRQLIRLPWVQRVLSLADDVALPLAVWLLGRFATASFRSLGWGHSFLAWIAPFVGLWLIFSFLDAFLSINLPAEQARVWGRQVLLPGMLLAAALHGVGLLDNVLQWGFWLPDGLHVTIGSLLGGTAVIAIFFALSRGARQFLARVFLPQAGAEPALTQAVSTLVAYAIIIVGMLAALNVLGVPLTTLAVVAGGLSVGLGFGLQDIVSNFVSGFILMFERSIGPRDVVQIGDTVGIVQTVGVRSMVIKTLDNVELIVPNSRFLTEAVTNFTRADPIVRVSVSVGVTYNSEPRDVEQALLEAAQHARVLVEPAPTVQFRDFAASSLNFDLLVWTDDAAGLPTLTSDLRYRIWDALAAHNIEIPFPQRDIHIRSIERGSAGAGAQG